MAIIILLLHLRTFSQNMSMMKNERYVASNMSNMIKIRSDNLKGAVITKR